MKFNMEEIILSSLKRYEDLLNRIESKIEGQKKVLTFDEAAKYSGISKSYLYKLTANGTIPHSKPNGKQIYFDREELESWLLSNKVKNKESIEKEALSYCSLSGRNGVRYGK
jgi:excisionase family DNA binding protein